MRENFDTTTEIQEVQWTTKTGTHFELGNFVKVSRNIASKGLWWGSCWWLLKKKRAEPKLTSHNHSKCGKVNVTNNNENESTRRFRCLDISFLPFVFVCSILFFSNFCFCLFLLQYNQQVSDEFHILNFFCLKYMKLFLYWSWPQLIYYLVPGSRLSKMGYWLDNEMIENKSKYDPGITRKWDSRVIHNMP